MIRKILKITGCTLLAVVLLITAVITVAVSYLKPERLTPLVEDIAGEFIDADLSIGRVEISFWSTFPRFELDVRDLQLNTRAFHSLPEDVRRQLPVWADSLLYVGRLNGGVHIPNLLAGKIALYDLIIETPRVNIVKATDDVWSLNVFPESADDEAETVPFILPDISMGTFRIDGGFPIRYMSLPDTLSVVLDISATELRGAEAPIYSLTFAGQTSAEMSLLTVKHLQLGLGGDINWSIDKPMRVALDDFRLRVGDVEAEINTSVDFENDLRFETLDFKLPVTPFKDIIAVIPLQMRSELGRVDSDLTLSCAMRLTRPFTVGVDSIPSFNMQVKVPEGAAAYDGMRLDKFELQVDAIVDGENLDKSVLSISRLRAIGEGMGFNLACNVADVISNPKVDGTFKGGLSVQHLPKSIIAMLPFEIRGLLKADCSFNLRKNYLNKDNFHKIRLKGEAKLTDLYMGMPELQATLTANEAILRLGTNSSFVRGEASVDSMLTVSFKVDTMAYSSLGLELTGRDLMMGVGCRNTSSTSDTTQINPIGARIKAGRLALRSDADSSRIYLRDATIGAALSRYKGNSRQPQLRVNLSSGTAVYGDKMTRAMLRDARATLNMHPSSSVWAQRRFAVYDSLRRAHPSLPSDSIRKMYESLSANRCRVRPDVGVDSVMNIAVVHHSDSLGRLGVDGSMRQLLRNWQAEGSLRAERMMLFTPLFPLRNRITGLNVDFSTDSIHIHETRADIGHSDFSLNGSITNITRALTSRSGRQSIVANFNLSCDTINVNELASAIFAGAAYAGGDSAGSAVMISIDEEADEASMQTVMDKAVSVDTASVLVIPSNIEATLNVKAKHIVYSDLVFHDFKGALNAYDGALNLSQLGARSDIGSINLNALYTAASKRSASFAFGMTLDGFRIGEFLALMPAMDSIMPVLQGIDGIIDANIAATTDLDSVMDIDIPTLKAAVKLSGDSLVVMDDETFRTVGKWLMFKHKEHNMIDSMTVEMIVDNSQMQMFPFMFNLDRYKLGVMGSNDMAMNFNYHVAVLKSPLPFKFGINITGNPDDMKIRVGKAKFNEKNMARTVSIADTTRINLVQEIRNVFRRGVNNGKLKELKFKRDARLQELSDMQVEGDTISAADSVYFIREGLLPPKPQPEHTDKKSGKRRKK